MYSAEAVHNMFVQEKLKLITVLGAGLLCGTALAVIIPEGVHALYEEILEGRVPRYGFSDHQYLLSLMFCSHHHFSYSNCMCVCL